MLEHLTIKNYALIENLEVDFSEGFNVITGETGAGKSIILGALGLLMGEKADSSSIRTGSDGITVNAVISIPQGHEALKKLAEQEIYPEDGLLIVNRTVKANGKSAIRIQDRIVTRAFLTEIADTIIDMHGQSEHQSLLQSDKQRTILDTYANNTELLKETSAVYELINGLESKEEEIKKTIEEGRKMEDYLKVSLEEIKSADPKIGEDDDLRDKISVLGQFESICENLSLCCDKLKESKSSLYDAVSYCSKASKADPALSEFKNRIESASIEADDIVQGLKEHLSSVDYSEDSLNQMQERLALLQKLKRKFGPELQNVLAFAEDAEAKLDITSNSELHLQKCHKELSEAMDSYNKLTQTLFENRKNSAGILENKIESVLRTLGMPAASFSIDVVNDPNKVSSVGCDTVQFMISANPGEPMKQMKEIASGGELSRVMLALKTVLAKSDSIETQVFDEIDSGIGGSVALSLADCICDLSKEKQVIAITHLASIASRADTQFVVSKEVVDGRTYSHLKHIEGETRVHEIARMLSGNEDEVALTHARRLLGN